MKVSGKMIKQVEKGFTSMQTALFTKADGLVISSTASVPKSGQTVQNLWGNTAAARNMALVGLSGLMALFTKGNLKVTTSMAKGLICGETAESLKASGIRIACMARGCSLGLMGVAM